MHRSGVSGSDALDVWPVHAHAAACALPSIATGLGNSLQRDLGAHVSWFWFLALWNLLLLGVFL